MMSIYARVPAAFRLSSCGLVLVLALAPGSLCAAEKNVKFRRISVGEGLSQAFVLCSLQDRQGFMWFATQEGLNRYDGYSFVTFTHDTEDPRSLSHDSVKTLLEDSEGVLWVGTDGGGLNRFLPAEKTFTHYRHDPDDPASLSDDRVWTILEDRSGRLWIGTDGGGLNLFDQAAGTFERFELAPPDPSGVSHGELRGLIEDQAGMLWIATDGGGLSRLDPATGLITHFRHDPDDPASLSSDRVRAVHEDRDGAIWAGTYTGGLNRLDRIAGTFSHFRHDPEDPHSLLSDTIWSIYRDREGALWIGTDEGLNLWDPVRRSFARYQHHPEDPYSLSNNRVNSIYQDRGGVLWIGTYDGVNKWNTTFGSFHHYQHQTDDPSQLSNNMVTSFAEDRNGKIWVGTYGGGVNYFDRASGTFHQYLNDPEDDASLNDNRVMSLAVDHTGVLWAGTMDGGLNRLDSAAGTFTHYRHDPGDPASLSFNGVTEIFEDRRGTLWVGTFRGGLNRFDRRTESFRRYRHDPADPTSLSSDRVLVMYEDSSGTLWVATHGGGLNRFDHRSQKFTSFRHDPEDPQSLSSDFTWTIVEDPRGDLWIGTQGAGLNRWSAADRAAGRGIFERFTNSDGLRSENIYGTLVDEAGNLWLSTNRGLTKFNPAADVFRHYDTSHGLQSDEFTHGASFRARDGQLFFGGINGFNAFYPHHIRENAHVPQVVLTQFLKFNESFDLGQPLSEIRDLELTHKDYVVAFEFAALDYTAPKKNRYMHKLEGFDRDWVDSGSLRRATYTNLESGDYTFRVKGSNNDGVWNEEGLALEIKALPPPWQTNWAYLAYVLAVSAALLLFARAQARKKQRAAELARANAVLKEEIAEREAKERALEREKEKAQSYLDVAEVIMVVIDDHGNVSLINQKGLEVLGCEEEDILGRNWFDHFVPQPRREEARAWLRDIHTKKNAGHEAYEYPVTTSGGDQRIIEWHTTRLPAENGKSPGTLSSGTDLTQERWLREAKEVAESANRSKSQFLANMSHEIRTPMNGILGMVELLLETDLTERQRQFAGTVHRSGRNLLDILNDILDFSKIEAGKLELEVVDFDLRHLVEDLAGFFAEHAHEKDLELLCSLDANMLTALSGDPTRLRQILSNLVGNAIKFTEKGEVAIKVVGHGSGASMEGVRFEVRDTGIGFDTASGDRIFESFQQADGSTTRKYGGTGLGLAISKELVAQMGGKMGVESSPGQGSTFWFVVPLERQRKPVEVKRPPSFDAGAPRVLVVDDNAASREYLLEQLAGAGVRCDAAEDGRQAVQMLQSAATRKDAYGLALVDQVMPGMSGPELVDNARSMSGMKDLSVVLLISAGLPDEEKIRQAGIRRCLKKPVRQSELFECLRAPVESAAMVVETKKQVTLSGASILLVEDNVVNQQVARVMLRNLEARVEVAESGLEAIDFVSQDDYDLILMDCQMPQMDGYEATRIIRQMEKERSGSGEDRRRERVPIVAMTANAMKGDRERCLATGMDDYLSKPFQLTQLRDCLERWLPEKFRFVEAVEAAPAQGPATETSAGARSFRKQRPRPRSTAAVKRPIVDRDALHDLRQIDPDGTHGIVEKMIRKFLDKGSQQVGRMREGVARSDTMAVKFTAHSMKASSGFLGARHLSTLCDDLETMARKNSLDQAPEVLSELEAEYEMAKIELQAELHQIRAAMAS